MKHFRNTFFYVALTIGFAAIIYFVYSFGTKLKPGINGNMEEKPALSLADSFNSFAENFQHPGALLLVQLIAIILVARLFGWLARKVGQPMVIGEIIAGIALGPSLLGYFFPAFSATLFPVTSLEYLKGLSIVGLTLFMFIVGMEVDLKMLKNKAHHVVVISYAGIIIPFTLGMALAYFLYIGYAPAGVGFLSFSLFLGISLSITAFPVLARILKERGMLKSRIGAMAITCAAANDITGWCLLAAVIAVVKADSFSSSLFVILLSTVYVVFMLKLIKPFLKRVGETHASRKEVNKSVMAVFFVVLLASAAITEIIGIHALFGAFMAGVVMPSNVNFKNIVIEKLEDLTLVLFLPLFFVFTGLRTQINLLNDPMLWLVTGAIILVAVLGKFAGTAIAAKVVGQSSKDSLTIGALMNTRGLMELIVLNIGYELGVITPVMFTMLVLMALLTTMMTGPVLNMINYFYKTETTNAPVVLTQKITEPIP